jgi:hypothetical protein
MSKKLLPNRSSKTVAPDALPKVRQAIALLEEVLGDPTPISDADYKALRMIADRLKRITDDVYEIVKENEAYVKAPLSLVEMNKDKTFYELCDSIRSLLNAFFLRLEREQNIAGAEYFNGCNVFEGDIVDAIGRDANDAKAQNIKAQLDEVDRKKGGGGKKNDDDDKNDKNDEGDTKPKK